MSLAFKIAGAAVMAGPAIEAVVQHIGDPASIPRWLLQNYTGVDSTTGTFYPEQLVTPIASIAGGTALVFIGKFIGKRLR